MADPSDAPVPAEEGAAPQRAASPSDSLQGDHEDTAAASNRRNSAASVADSLVDRPSSPPPQATPSQLVPPEVMEVKVVSAGAPQEEREEEENGGEATPGGGEEALEARPPSQEEIGDGAGDAPASPEPPLTGFARAQEMRKSQGSMVGDLQGMVAPADPVPVQPRPPPKKKGGAGGGSPPPLYFKSMTPKVTSGMHTSLSVLTLELPTPGRRTRKPARGHQGTAKAPPPRKAAKLPVAEEAPVALLDGFLLLSCGASELPEEVTHVSVAGRGLSAVEESDLHFFSELHFLDASDNGVPDLACFAQLPALSQLNLQCNALSRVTVDPGAGFPHLRTLDLSYNRLGGEALAVLSQMPLLEDLDLACNSIMSLPPGLLDALARVERGGEEAGAGAGHAEGAAAMGEGRGEEGGGQPPGTAASGTSMRSVSFAGADTPAAAGEIGGGAAAEPAAEDGAGGAASGWGRGVPFPSLARLDLGANKLGGGVLRPLGALPALRELRVAANGIRRVESAVASPGCFPSLELLDLSSNAVEYEDDLDPLAALPRLLEVIVVGNPLAHRQPRGLATRPLVPHTPPGTAPPTRESAGGRGTGSIPSTAQGAVAGAIVVYSMAKPPAAPSMAALYGTPGATGAVDDTDDLAPASSAMVFKPKHEIEGAFARLDQAITENLRRSSYGGGELTEILNDMGGGAALGEELAAGGGEEGAAGDDAGSAGSGVFITEAPAAAKPGRRGSARSGGVWEDEGGDVPPSVALARALGVHTSTAPPQFRDAAGALNALKFALAHPLVEDYEEVPRHHRKLTAATKARMRETLPPPPALAFEAEKEHKIESVENILATMRSRLTHVEKSLAAAATKEGLVGAGSLAERQLA